MCIRDRPKKACDKHITVEWCSVGDGAANEYCKLSGASIVSKGLVKYTRAELDEIKKAGNVTGFSDSIVYLVDGDKGAPMKTCTVHTAASILPPTPPENPENPEGGTGADTPAPPANPETPEAPATPDTPATP